MSEPVSTPTTPISAPSTTDTDKAIDELDKKVEELSVVQGSGLLPGDDEAVVIDQNDPNSPLYSVKTFEALGLRADLLKGIYGMGFTKPSKIQETALPLILGTQNTKPKNLIAQSQSGTGKTAAFVLSMLSKVDPDKKGPQALCVVPTRELAIQVAGVVNQMAKYTTLKILLVIPQADIPKNNIEHQVIIGTPGKLLDVRALNLKQVRCFVLDEADVMLDKQGLADQSVRLRRLLPNDCQLLLFSATYNTEVQDYAKKVIPEPRSEIMLKREDLSLKKIEQFYIECESQDKKFDVLSDIYGYISVGQSMIFVNARETAEKLSKRMKSEGHQVSLLHGGLQPTERDDVTTEFRKGTTRVLITTNVLARGIDIPSVTLVINYDVPVNTNHKPDFETYLHRIGRSGRFGQEGVAITFVQSRYDQSHMKEIEEYFKKPVKELKVDDIPKISDMLKKLHMKPGSIQK